MYLAPSNKITLSGPILLLVLFSCVGVSFLHNGFYLFCCLFTLYVLLYLTWRPYQPAIISLAFITQWTQVVTFVIWMNTAGLDINFLSAHGGTAVVCSCLGLIIMAFVINKRVQTLRFPTAAEFKKQAERFNDKKVLILYLGSTFFLSSLAFAFIGNSGFAQIILTLNTVKWVFFLAYGYLSWVKRKNLLILTLIILFEFGSGFYSFFSTFKEVILYTIIIAMTFIRQIRFKQLVIALTAAFALFFILLTWTAIKDSYRNYLNKGSRQQEIKVSKEDAFGKIGDELNNLNWAQYNVALNSFFYRLQYVYHLALVMDRVPDVMPHEYGAVWWGNVSFVLMPRLLFPNKPIFDATIKTNKYTGLSFGGFKEGSSFSIPYFSDGYIDFGYAGMYFPLILLALFISWIYRFFMKQHQLNILLRFAFINITLFSFFSFESDGVIVFGRLVLLFLIITLMAKFVFPRVQQWLYQ